MEIEWSLLPFNELSLDQLYEILAFRQEVFVVEQDCPYLDADGRDSDCWHLFGTLPGKMIAYSRIVPPGLIFKEASIGRVMTRIENRKKGEGKLLMAKSIQGAQTLFGEHIPIRISAQQYLLRFYGELGFVSTGKKYLEDGIPHVEMLKIP